MITVLTGDELIKAELECNSSVTVELNVKILEGLQ